ncbi:MAG: ATP-grasp domain-containing protein [Labilithrix sp.]|nr:ATP-grasp domain-containing protein [Labilithrix sp.]MCW5810903.1 ATP-grasp domain-containing protein [Labilithrix sp.]
MARNVVFISPFPTEATLRFIRAVSKMEDVRLLGVVHTPPPGADALFHDFVRVTEPMNVEDSIEAIEILKKRHGDPYRIVGVLEAMTVHVAQVREHFGVPGTSSKVAELFRDKARMKDTLRAAGLPVARHKVITSASDATELGAEVGYPIIVKPLAGLGSRATFRVRSEQEFLSAIASTNLPVLAEEMLVGTEHTMETITIDGEPRVVSFSRYYPSCLEAVENPWIQWACVLPREIDDPVYEEAKKLGVAAIAALGLETEMTHMEWFQRKDGSLAIGEIAQRPPGPQLCQMTGLVHDVDVYRAWGRAVIDGAFDGPWERKYAAGAAFIRSVGHGRVIGVSGLRETHQQIGLWLVEAKIPSIGDRKGEGYEGDGYIVVKAESTKKVQELIDTIVNTIRIAYSS